MKLINIMTSCDDALASYIFSQIASIGVNLNNYSVNFFLFHNRISLEKINSLKQYAKSFKNISFKEIFIEDIEPYKQLVMLGTKSNKLGRWPYETYFSLCCHTYLPEDVDRILYIDAGDVIIDGDIGEYYFGDFEGCSIIATILKFNITSEEVRTFKKDDMFDSIKNLRAIKGGIFNSGAYVINVSKFRKARLTIDDYIFVANTLQDYTTKDELQPYLGDQGLLSVVFIGDIKFFAYPKIKDVYYMPYNFCIYFFDSRSDLWYTPKIIHYAGSGFKPWNARFSVAEVEKYKFKTDFDGTRAPFYLKGKEIEFFEIWWRYCEMTPVYKELNYEASIYAEALEKHFLPLCKKYNDICTKLNILVS